MMGLRRLVREALVEDIGQGDITTRATTPSDARCQAHLYAKEDGVLSGIEVFRAVFETLHAKTRNWRAMQDGQRFHKGDTIASFYAEAQAVLTGERVALNFIQRLSGIATHTARYVEAVDGLDARICDTRKTTPLLRTLEKQAVLHGGGANHRYALFDGVLIKENHIVAAGGVQRAVQKALRGTHHLMKIGIEVTNLDEFDQAVAARADAVLLDNMSIEDMREAVRRAQGTDIVLEASGNVTLDRVRAIAETGVHFISVGALTHSAAAVDMTLLISNV